MAVNIAGITMARTVVTVPVADIVAACLEASADCFCGSGSGSGSGPQDCNNGDCVNTARCPGGMSSSFTLNCATATSICFDDLDGTADTDATLNYVCNSNDGGTDRFISTSGSWQMYFDTTEGLWIIESLNYPGAKWVVFADLCAVNLPPGEFVSAFPIEGSGAPLQLHVTHDCQTITYNCVDGVCVSVAGAGGTYATAEECTAACGGSGSGSGPGCDCPHGPETRTLTVTAAGIPDIDGRAYDCPWNAVIGSWVFLTSATFGVVCITSINIDISCNVIIGGVCADGISTWGVVLPCATGTGTSSGCVSGETVSGVLS